MRRKRSRTKRLYRTARRFDSEVFKYLPSGGYSTEEGRPLARPWAGKAVCFFNKAYAADCKKPSQLRIAHTGQKVLDYLGKG